jgi:3-hydroxyisobutyrate dehydrogenase
MSVSWRVLFIGLGMMGSPMARRLDGEDVELTLFDVDPDRVTELAAELNAIATPDPVGAAARADVVALMLPNSGVVERVLLDSGVLAAMPAGSVLLDMSSSRPASTVELARKATEHGVSYVDAPVSGGRSRAVTGELSIMAGGLADVIMRVRPLLARMGTSITHTGTVGSGHAMKALNNLLSAIGLLGAAEVITAGAKFGLDPALMVNVLNQSTGRNHATEVKFERFVLSGKFNSGFALDLMVKDLCTALELAEDSGMSTPLSEHAVGLVVEAARQIDDPTADHTELARWVAKQARADLKKNGKETRPQ